MPRKLYSLCVAFGVLAVLGASAHASPTCMKEKKPFTLEDDTVTWTMTAQLGSECIQGLRWSYMQIYNVVIAKAPTHGKIVIVGSGFRYFANSEAREADSFTLEVWGKNLRNPGKSIIEVAVAPPPGPVVAETPRRP